ncbi:MAG: SDR family oxidoreductase [Bacilli bacterium]|nr:SDR family oxidoreductase [Bacilli bacterium]MBN2696222.1 SDR family oxidoreductase [Bacilli bacterium]
MKVLIIGGTGTISKHVVKECIRFGMDVTVMNRGHNNDKLPENVNLLLGDINKEEAAKELLKNKYFDSVVQFVAYTQSQVERDVRLFTGKTDQYIFISSASAYHKPVLDYPITENTPLHNPYWEYSRNKIACETYLKSVKDLNVTIVRPSHTYDNRMIMAVMTRWQYEYGHILRLMKGKPIIIPGDGTSLWTITHASDFANSFVYLIGNPKAYNDVFHITGEKVYTWEQLTNITAQALGVTAHIVHVPSNQIVKYMPEMEGPLLGDKSWSAIFDNSKIKAISQHYTSNVSYEDVIDDVISYYHENKELQRISTEYEELYDKIVELYKV